MKKKKSEFHQEAWEMYIQTGAVSQIQFAFQLKKKNLNLKKQMWISALKTQAYDFVKIC